MIIAGVDGSPDIVASLKAKGSRIVASSSQDPYGMARQAAEMAVELLNGKKPAKQVTLLDTKLVTRETVNNYVGWDAKR